MRKGVLGTVAVGLSFVWAQSVVAGASEIKVLGAAGAKVIFSELAPQFERATGHKVVLKLVNGPSVRREIDAGDAFDVALSQTEVIDRLIQEGRIVGGTSVNIARTGLGIAMRSGAPKPDITSVDAFKRALLNAKTFAYSNEGASGVYFLTVLDRLGIAADMKAKLIAKPSVGLFDVVANGEAEMALGTVPGILSVPAVELVGPLPSELQTWIAFTGGIVTGAKESDAGKALLAFLTTRAATQILKAKGYEPFPR
jgi:molybdate transport system substrate-binding protein